VRFIASNQYWRTDAVLRDAQGNNTPLNPVLLLNASYEPLRLCPWRRAVLLLLKGKAETVEHHDKTLYPGMQSPTVIRLRYYVKLPYKDIPMTRRNIMHRDAETCQYCGKRSDLTLDHVLPRSRGGGDHWENVVVACLRCNVTKGNRTPEEANMKLAKRPMRPVYFAQFELSKQRKVSQKLYASWQKYFFDLGHDTTQ
jgi:5-methylcytosine-specific restriction endonuclease McrA